MKAMAFGLLMTHNGPRPRSMACVRQSGFASKWPLGQRAELRSAITVSRREWPPLRLRI